MTSKVETFEHNIAEEIKRKEATAAQIASVSNTVENNPTPETVPTAKKKTPIFLITVGVLFVFSILGLGGLGYFYFTDTLLPPSAGAQIITKEQIPKELSDLNALSLTLGTEIGRYVTSVEKQQAGYIITINSYSPVFSYMVKNEDAYIQELAASISPVVPGSQVTTPSVEIVPKQPTTTPALSTTTAATTTKNTKTSTSTLKISSTSQTKTASTTTGTNIGTTTPINQEGPYYKDITVSNQNMRVWTSSNKQTVVYAFITDTKIALSKTTEGILSLKGAIIR